MKYTKLAVKCLTITVYFRIINASSVSVTEQDYRFKM